MLMIPRVGASQQWGTLKLEGKLLGPWVGELETACREALATGSPVCLDLRDLTFVDTEGARLLASVIRDGAQVTGCSGFIAGMLDLEEC
jgi:anti-anti-sigma regulatory factor